MIEIKWPSSKSNSAPTARAALCALLLVSSGLLSLKVAVAQTDAATPAAPTDPHVLSGMWTTFPGGGMGAAAGGPGGPPQPEGMGGGGGMGAAPAGFGNSRLGTLPVIKPAYVAKYPQDTPAPNQGELPNSDASRLCIPDAFFGSGGGYPTLIVQTAKQVTLINEEDHRTRRIYLDRQHPKKLTPSYAGHSIGHWEGNTLVVNTVGLANREGKKNPPGYYVEERFTRKNSGQQLEWVISFHSDAYATPGSKTITYNWRPDLHIQEQICEEFSDNFNDSYKFK